MSPLELLLECAPWALIVLALLVGMLTGAGLRDDQLFRDPARLARARRRWLRRNRRKAVAGDEKSTRPDVPGEAYP
jgi:hypothetical protein